jgi:hypothetical protein
LLRLVSVVSCSLCSIDAMDGVFKQHGVFVPWELCFMFPAWQMIFVHWIQQKISVRNLRMERLLIALKNGEALNSTKCKLVHSSITVNWYTRQFVLVPFCGVLRSILVMRNPHRSRVSCDVRRN